MLRGSEVGRGYTPLESDMKLCGVLVDDTDDESNPVPWIT